LCAAIVALCWWVSHPVAEMAFMDDWAYAKTAQVFVQTGQFVYNGWNSQILGWQVVWGALFIKLFGFSFFVLRLSTLLVAIATVFLFHSILIRFGVNAKNAVLGTLTLGLSPLFLPLAASYMTDVPALFVILLCLYCCQKAVAARGDSATIGWLCLAAASNVVVGTARQIAWLGALVMVPSVGWLLRGRRGVLWVSALLWAASVVSVILCMRWFARQPYALTEVLFGGTPGDGAFPVVHTLLELVGALLCLLLVMFPITVAWMPEIRRLHRGTLVQLGCVVLVLGFFQWITRWTLPWLSHVIRLQFAATRAGNGERFEPFSMPLWMLEAVSLLVLLPSLVLLARSRSAWSSLMEEATEPTVGGWRDVVWLLGPFSVSYVVMLLPRAYQGCFSTDMYCR
jgi:4-amino-4-deoxy-L-arabinose transferase-like glycosyltransferase